jgi:hypothetical protein
MKNPLIHGLVLIMAMVIPGGLLVYFAWRIKKHTTIPRQLIKKTPKEAEREERC